MILNPLSGPRPVMTADGEGEELREHLPQEPRTRGSAELLLAIAAAFFSGTPVHASGTPPLPRLGGGLGGAERGWASCS